MKARIELAVGSAMRGDAEATALDEGWRVEVWRGGARLKFDLYPGERVGCVSLSSPDDVEGWLADANRLVTDVLGPEFGVRHVEMVATTPRAAETFCRHAPYELVRGDVYRWTL